MKKKTLIALALGMGIFLLPINAQLYQTCDQWGNYSTSGYTIYNNIWGSGAGSQCLTVNAYNNWYVDANHPAGSGGVKSYPNVERQVSLNVDNMGSVTSIFAVSRPSGGSYSSTYDIWYNNYAYEIMLWMNYNGAVGPIASSYNCNGACPETSNVSIGGHTWNVYRGSNGSNQVFSFLRTSNTNSGTVDITAISQWLRNNGWFGNVNLHSIQFGFEITATSGSQRFSVTNFSVSTDGDSSSGGSSSGGSSSGGGCTPTSITPYVQVNDGTWQQTSSVTVSSGAKVKFGPQPTSGGSWSWSGCGTSGSSREQTVYPTSSCTATATYTNSCGANSSQNFNVTVSGGSSGGGTGNILIRARGTQGSENIAIQVNGSTVASYTLTTSYANYYGNGSGTVRVAFTNDNGSRDVQVDYVQINGTTYQSENQAVNTGVWQNNSCGGSNSEWLQCNGYIEYGSGGSSSGGSSSGGSSSGGSSSGGSSGGGSTCSNPTTVSLPYVHNGSGTYCWFTTGTFSNVNSWGTNSVTINGTDYTNRWSNSFPARTDGGYYIAYSASNSWSHFEANAKSAVSPAEETTDLIELNVFPNPSPCGNFTIQVIGGDYSSQLRIMDISGKQLQELNIREDYSESELSLSSGVYVIQLIHGDKMIIKKLVVE